MSDYCRCGADAEPYAGQRDVGTQRWQVCGVCNKIHHVVQEEVDVVRGPVDAQALLHAHLHENGTSDLFWATPRGKVQTIEYNTYPRKIPGMSSEPLIYSTWSLLMSKVDVILAPVEGAGDNALVTHSREIARHEARGIAQALSILMAPFMENADAVVRAAVAKHKDADFEVPGLGAHLWDPYTNPDGSPRTVVATPRSRPAAAPKKAAPVSHKGQLKPDEIEGVREAIKSGMFTEQEVADMFKASIESVRAAVAG